MAGKKISELVATTELETTDELILRRADDNKKITGASIASSLVAGNAGAIQFNGGGSFAGFGTWDADKSRLLLNSAPFAGLFSLAGVIFAADGVAAGNFAGFNEQTVFFQGMRGTLADPLASHIDDSLGGIEWWGTGSGDAPDTGNPAAVIDAWVDGDVGVGLVPGRIRFRTQGASGLLQERLRIDSNGVVSVGRDVAAGAAISVSDFGSSHLVATGYQGILLVEVGSASQLNFAAANGPDFNSPEAVLNNQRLGEIRFWGYDGTSYSDASAAATIIGYADAQASSVFVPGRLSFSTQGVDAGSPVERLRIDSTGHVIIGKAGAVNTPDIGASDAALIVEGDGTVAGSAGIALNGAGPNTAYLRTGYARGTLAARTAVVDGDFLFDFQTQGYDGSSYESAARMSVRADGDPVDNSAVPSRFEFYTSDSAGSVTERLRIDSKGLVTVGTVAPLFQIAQPGLSTTFQGEPGFSSWAINIWPGGSLLAFQHAGGTLAAPTVSQNGKRLGIIEFWGTGTGVDDTGDSAAFIEANVEGAAGVGFVPGRLGFWTTDPAGDFYERLRISNKGVVSVGIDPAAGASISAADFSSAPLAVTGHAGVLLVEVGLPPQLHFAAASGSYSEFSSPAAVVSGQQLGEIYFYGHDGTSYANAAPAASIIGVSDTQVVVDSGIVPGRIVFQTQDASGFLKERLRIDSAGNISFGDPSTAKLTWDEANQRLRIGDPGGTNFGPAALLINGDGVTFFPTLALQSSNRIPTQFTLIASDGTLTSPTDLTADDNIFLMSFENAGTSGGLATFTASVDVEGAPRTRLAFSTSDATGSLFERLRIDSKGFVSIGEIIPDGTVPALTVTTENGIIIRLADALVSPLYLQSSRGTIASPTSSNADDVVGWVEFEGCGTFGGADFNTAARIQAEVDTTPGSGIVPGRLKLLTSGVTGSAHERIRLDSLGGAILPEEFANGADPAAPASGARLYCVQTAGGKTQLAVRFPSGAAQIIATEP